MTDDEFDTALVTSAFSLGGAQGWGKVHAAAAANAAGLDLARARTRFASIKDILQRFGHFADIHALRGVMSEGSPRDRLFDILLRRFDFFHTHRAGVTALLRSVALNPPLAIWLARETLRSMGWLLEAAGLAASGKQGELRKHGLLAVWAWGLRAWLRDETADLSATMAAVDTALARAHMLASNMAGKGFSPSQEAEIVEPELPLEPPATY